MTNFDVAANQSLNSKLNYNNAYNPQSAHKLGATAKRFQVDAHNVIYNLFPNFKHFEFIAGGGTNANKRAFACIPLRPVRQSIQRNKYRDIVLMSAIEHKSIHEIVTTNLRNHGYTVVRLPSNGNISTILDEAMCKYGKRVAMVSIMTVNNETGVIHDIPTLVNIVKTHDAECIFHTDACHAIHMLSDIQVDIATISLYKIGGPHIGMVFTNVELRSDYFGTPDVAMECMAVDALVAYIQSEQTLDSTRNILREKMAGVFDRLQLNVVDLSPVDKTVPTIQSYLLPPPFESKIIQEQMSERGFYIGSGSACSTESKIGSHVAIALGFQDASFGLVRFSFDSQIDSKDIDDLGEALYDVISKINKQIIPLPWTVVEPKCEELVPLDINTNRVLTLETPLSLPLEPNPPYNMILLGISELYLKGNNRHIFSRKLKDNIHKALNGKDFKLKIIRNRFSIHCNDALDYLATLQRIPGITTIRIGTEKSDVSLECICQLVASYVFKHCYKEFPLTFKIDTRQQKTNRIDGNGNTQMNYLIGQYIMDRFNGLVAVDLDNPTLTLHVDVHNGHIMVSDIKQSGTIGLPSGTEGRLLCIIRPDNYLRAIVSCHKMINRGCVVDFIFQRYPHPRNSIDQTILRTLNVLRHYQLELNCLDRYDIDMEKYAGIINEPSSNRDCGRIWWRAIKILEWETNVPVISNTVLMTNMDIMAYLTPICNFDMKLDNIGSYFTEKGSCPKGKVLMLLSGGLDSPVAAYQLIHAGYDVHYIHYTAEIDKQETVCKIRDQLHTVTGHHRDICVVQFAELQDEIVRVSPEPYRTLMYKVFMLLLAQTYAQENDIDFLATGNSWGQVASQTPDNIRIQRQITKLPIISPLLGFCKEEIISIARNIGTYELSTCQGTGDCCIRFMPAHPIIRGKLSVVTSTFQKIDPLLVDHIDILTL